MLRTSTSTVLVYTTGIVQVCTYHEEWYCTVTSAVMSAVPRRSAVRHYGRDPDGDSKSIKRQADIEIDRMPSLRYELPLCLCALVRVLNVPVCTVQYTLFTAVLRAVLAISQPVTDTDIILISVPYGVL